MKKSIIIFLIFTGTLIFSNNQNGYYISNSKTTNLHSSRTVPPKTGIPDKREAGVVEFNLEIY